MASLKVTYIISNINKALIFEWLALDIDKEDFALSFILLNPGTSEFEIFLKQNGFDVYRVCCLSKKDWIKAFFTVFNILKTIKPDSIHCHFLTANIIGLGAGLLAGIKKRIYTRHHSAEHHKYHPKGVLWDELINTMATDIVAISKNVRRIVINWEHTKRRKVTIIPHGIKYEAFSQVSDKRVKAFRYRNDLEGIAPVIGIVSRFVELKGLQYIIPAFKRLIESYPNAVLLLLNAQGDYEKVILRDLGSIPRHNYRLVPFENDIAAAYHAMDIVVHVPIDKNAEAFGQVYLEALVARRPCIFTPSGIAADFILDGFNAFLVPFKDANAIYIRMIDILVDKTKAREMAYQGSLDIKKLFSFDTMIKSLENLYARK